MEAQIAEIKQLQAEHKAAISKLADQFSDKQREQSLAAEEMQKNYFDRHPDQSDADRLRDAEQGRYVALIAAPGLRFGIIWVPCELHST